MTEEDGMRALGDLVRSILATQKGDGSDESESPESPRPAPLWAGFVLWPNDRTVELRVLSLDKDQAIQGVIDGDLTRIVMDVTRDDAHHEFTDWLVDVGDFIATEAESEWNRLLEEAKDRWGVLATTLATKAAVLGDLAKVPGLAPCPACGETKKIGLKACMGPGGARCCPWVKCKTCHYSGPRGIDQPGTDGQPATDAAVEAVRAWNDGDLDLVAFAGAKVKLAGGNTDDTWELSRTILEGGQQFTNLLATQDAVEREIMGTVARVLGRRIGEIFAQERRWEKETNV